ncbi:hypothetical protein N7508_001952 [Penicillium antarcticum]|uniref:uncharacterized protein n=1 Tax=Penicillium antarcticum TaxID=416450 RepID=UPI00238F4FA8|nr:uncharacterized protein N7508_001952 [Penicillium antarcticum]KAJ5317444.1 hypothetical protein N7508_001952 [Penicillium antarcticum]
MAGASNRCAFDPTVPGPNLPRTHINLEEIEHAARVLRDCSGVFQSYKGVFGGNEPLAPRLIDPPNEELEDVLVKLFGGPPTCSADLETPGAPSQESQSQGIVRWSEILSKQMGSRDFEIQSNGTYWCRVKGLIVNVSEENYRMILSGLPQRMVKPWSHLQPETERDLAHKLSARFSQCYGIVLDLSLVLQRFISDLENRLDEPTSMSERDESPMNISSSWQKREILPGINESERITLGGEEGGANLRARDSLSCSTGSDIPFDTPATPPSKPQARKRARRSTRHSSASNRIFKAPVSSTISRDTCRVWDKTTTGGSKVPNCPTASSKAPGIPGQLYSEQELAEGLGFLQPLIDQGADIDTITAAYESKFKISRTYRGLKDKFKLPPGKQLAKARLFPKVSRSPCSDRELADGPNFLHSLVDQEVDMDATTATHGSAFKSKEPKIANESTDENGSPERPNDSSRYTKLETDEGYDFLKGLIDDKAGADEIVKAYKAKFGISRSYLGLLLKFQLRHLNPPKGSKFYPRYSDQEYAEGPAFVVSLIQRGADVDAIENAYEEKFGVRRTYLAIRCKLRLPSSLNGVQRENKENTTLHTDSDDSDF